MNSDGNPRNTLMIMLSVNRMRQTTSIFSLHIAAGCGASPCSIHKGRQPATVRCEVAFEVLRRTRIWTKGGNKYLVISCMINVKVN